MGQCESRHCDKHGSSAINKIIFLDVDGVLNSYAERNIQFKCECLYMLKTIVEESNAVIVLSTSWRLKSDLRKKLREKLGTYHLHSPISVTPRIKNGSRVSEILLWLKENTNVNIFKSHDDNDGNTLYSSLLDNLVDDDDELEDWKLSERLENITHWIVLDDLDFANRKDDQPYYSLIHKPSNHIIHTDLNKGLTVQDTIEACRLLGLDVLQYRSCQFCYRFMDSPQSIYYDFIVFKIFCGKQCVNKYYESHHITNK